MTPEPSLLSEVRFGAFLQYSPHGESDPSRRSRSWRDNIKRDVPGAIARVVGELLKREEARALRDELLGDDVVLVPTPRSAPLRPGALWPGRRICEEIETRGLGKAVLPCIERRTAVQKSAFAARGERPTPQTHFESLRVTGELLSAGRLLLVDDFVTKGATLLAAASLLKATYPKADIACFALVRTMGLVPEVEGTVAPCVGTIRLSSWGDALREP